MNYERMWKFLKKELGIVSKCKPNQPHVGEETEESVQEAERWFHLMTEMEDISKKLSI